MKKFLLKCKKGQSAAELAIFGSIVIFIIGAILKTSLSISYGSNTDLRAFRFDSLINATGTPTAPANNTAPVPPTTPPPLVG